MSVYARRVFNIRRAEEGGDGGLRCWIWVCKRWDYERRSEGRLCYMCLFFAPRNSPHSMKMVGLKRGFDCIVLAREMLIDSFCYNNNLPGVKFEKRHKHKTLIWAINMNIWLPSYCSFGFAREFRKFGSFIMQHERKLHESAVCVLQPLQPWDEWQLLFLWRVFVCLAIFYQPNTPCKVQPFVHKACGSFTCMAKL